MNSFKPTKAIKQFEDFGYTETFNTGHVVINHEERQEHILISRDNFAFRGYTNWGAYPPSALSFTEEHMKIINAVIKELKEIKEASFDIYKVGDLVVTVDAPREPLKIMAIDKDLTTKEPLFTLSNDPGYVYDLDEIKPYLSPVGVLVKEGFEITKDNSQHITFSKPVDNFKTNIVFEKQTREISLTTIGKDKNSLPTTISRKLLDNLYDLVNEDWEAYREYNKKRGKE